jgi:hypothetical protein
MYYLIMSIIIVIFFEPQITASITGCCIKESPMAEIFQKNGSIRNASTLLMAFSLLSLCGCSQSNRKPVYPVRGKVTFKGQPIPGALVVFHSVGNDEGSAERPFAKVEPDGTFNLGTYEHADGAPAGTYLVTVELWLSNGTGDEGPTSRLPAKYANPKSSGLTATIDTGPTELQPFLLN